MIKITAITVTEAFAEPVTGSIISGTVKRRSKLYVRFTSATTGETLVLTTLDATIADIEGIVYETDDGASVNTSGTAATWSTVTLTSNTAGTEEICLMVTHT